MATEEMALAHLLDRDLPPTASSTHYRRQMWAWVIVTFGLVAITVALLTPTRHTGWAIIPLLTLVGALLSPVTWAISVSNYRQARLTVVTSSTLERDVVVVQRYHAQLLASILYKTAAAALILLLVLGITLLVAIVAWQRAKVPIGLIGILSLALLGASLQAADAAAKFAKDLGDLI